MRQRMRSANLEDSPNVLCFKVPRKPPLTTFVGNDSGNLLRARVMTEWRGVAELPHSARLPYNGISTRRNKTFVLIANKSGGFHMQLSWNLRECEAR